MPSTARPTTRANAPTCSRTRWRSRGCCLRNRCQILATGGSHVPYFRKVGDAGWAVNPGSVGLSLNGEPGADVCVLRIDEVGVEVEMDKVDYDYAAVAFDIVAWGLPKAVAEAIQMGRMSTRIDP